MRPNTLYLNQSFKPISEMTIPSAFSWLIKTAGSEDHAITWSQEILQESILQVSEPAVQTASCEELLADMHDVHASLGQEF